jgi:hypothetical protein
MVTKQQYLWVQETRDAKSLQVIDDPVQLFMSGKFDPNIGKIYQIGSEVKVQVSIEPIPNYRSKNTPTRS